MVTNSTLDTLLNRRSIRAFKDEAIDDDTRAALESAAQHAASSQFLNDWSAIRITTPHSRRSSPNSATSRTSPPRRCCICSSSTSTVTR